ncbi:calmodulin-binding protein 25 [Ziziphus jujuba]|uniref:Calmodulin-binding protein 25 n=1 Tax=Ziziphus jujuba TaxID=326968 RepID=A0A6P4ARA8_ZIZJJ|nr:calmodulin-binding protein 25 [Ziziphus jujuba]
MAASENLAGIEPWSLRPTTLADSWISEAFARDTETLTRALQKSFSNSNTEAFDHSDTISPFIKPETVQTPTVSGLSGSDPETAAHKRQRSAIPPTAGGKVSKRKSRASKKSQTTFITADPANFRQMVQQVTGVRFGNTQVPMPPMILKPEPQRPGHRLPGGGCLPTLDTSAFLLDHHLQQVAVTGAAAGGNVSGVPDGGALDFDTFPSFPTLESWKVM